MKKIYSLTLIAFASLGFGQNLVTNGDFETWTDATTPESFSAAPFTANVTQETTSIHGGMYSAKHTTPATGSVKIQNETAVLVPGNTYTVSYWFLDNDPLARSRPWIYFLDAANATMTDAATDAAFRPATYSNDDPNWIEFTTTFTAPANAVKLRFEVRTYAVAPGLGSVYYDDISVVENTASTNNNNIVDLKVYSNNKMLYISSDNTDNKNVFVYDLSGKVVANETITTQAINISSLATGAYIVKVIENEKTATVKLLVK